MWGQRDSAGPAPRSYGSGLLLREPVVSASGAATATDARVDAGGARERLPVASVLLGTYRLDRVLGVGGMATVFAATHLRNANRVAVKVLHPELEENTEVRARFLREGYAANSVQHAGTVRVLDDGIAEGGAVFLVMELLDGETLEALWERRGRRLPAAEVAHLMGQLLDVLSAAHERGIVHRDIKPENIFIERDGSLRILDFGVARVLHGTVAETRGGSVIGTLPYMAPEQILGKIHEVDARVDVWSVGATAFTLVSGRFVHEAETPEEMMVFTGSRQARSLASVAPQVPRAFIEVVDRALRFDKHERWPTAHSMLEALRSTSEARAAGQEAPGSARIVSLTDAPTPVRVGAPPRVRRTAVFAIAVAVAGVGFTAAERLRPLDPPRAVVAPSHAMLRPSAGAVLAPAFAPGDPSPGESGATSLASEALAAVATATQREPTTHDVASPPTPEDPKVATSAAGAPSGLAARPASIPHAGPSAGSPAPVDCAPPFTILPVTGKKRWKRECL